MNNNNKHCNMLKCIRILLKYKVLVYILILTAIGGL